MIVYSGANFGWGRLYFVAHYGKLLVRGEGCAIQTVCT
jgi:hypothetical protein